MLAATSHTSPQQCMTKMIVFRPVRCSGIRSLHWLIRLTQAVFTVPFVETNADLFNPSESFVAEIQARHQSCRYADYIDKYLTIPQGGVNRPNSSILARLTVTSSTSLTRPPSTLTPALTSTKSPKYVPCRGMSSASPLNSSTRPQVLTSTST